MRPCFLIFSFLLPLCLPAQRRDERNPEALFRPKDTTRIDSMNARGNRYAIESVKDSAEYYAGAAFRASEKLHYVHGLAMALLLKSFIAAHFYNDFQEEGRLSLASLGWFRQTGNKDGLPRLYIELAFSYFCQGKY